MQIKDKVFTIVSKIPKGKTRTYKQIAVKLNISPRYVARILSKNQNPIKIPCHRVICSNGKIGGYTFKGKFNPKMKIRLLKNEGVKI
ncbi:MAG: MGMT family protein [Candidatus Nanoarchaeia archaeon]|nr:MGMT family protein [Candidatus Nanoarchaeia archaeon]